MRNRLRVMVIVMAAVSLFAAGCKKKVAVAPPLQPPSSGGTTVPPQTPGAKIDLAEPPRIVSFTAEPASIERNQSATLRWTVTGTNPELILDPGLGIVTPTGDRQVFPAATTTYTLTARSAIGMDSRSVTIEVRTPPAPPPKGPVTTTGTRTPREILIEDAKDIYFDYDMSELRPDARQALNADAELLRRIFAADPNFNVVIEGHCDERGSAEYNIGLGDRRATVTKNFLVQLGLPANRMRIISLGEERPVCTEQNEACYQRNRRAHLAPGQ